MLCLLLGLVRVEAPLLAAADSTMRPQAFENHLRGGGRARGVFAILYSEAADVLHQSLNLRELVVTLGSRGELGEFQLAADFKPLYDSLEIYFSKMFAEDAADGGANQLAGDGVGSLELAFVFEFELAGDGGKRGINIGDARDR